jgi:hypothetical protein
LSVKARSKETILILPHTKFNEISILNEQPKPLILSLVLEGAVYYTRLVRRKPEKAARANPQKLRRGNCAWDERRLYRHTVFHPSFYRSRK